MLFIGEGSSPRMRGALICKSFLQKCKGIIPADAGSTSLRMRGLSAGPDHPRGCGEHVYRCLEAMGCLGSSPRMRGAQQRGKHPTGLGRIIPADAGSTDPKQEYLGDEMDHPRGCGEHATGAS